jgi:hypothetical protein
MLHLETVNPALEVVRVPALPVNAGMVPSVWHAQPVKSILAVTRVRVLLAPSPTALVLVCRAVLIK